MTRQAAILLTEVDLLQISEILQELGSKSPQPAWETFLDRYSPIVLQVVRLFENNEDDAADCFMSSARN